MANVYWTGGAPAKFDVWDITLANTWATNDIARLTIGTKDLLVTVGSSTLATIATEIIASINATDFSDPAPPANFSRNVGGQQIPEFTEITASAHPTNTAIVRITANTAGVPIGVTAGETTAGDGTFTASNSTVATGPNFLDNADNYLGGSLPVDDDTLYFDIGSVSALYGLTYFRANSIDLTMYLSTDWTGQLGLPPTNSNGYAEYRQRYFQYRGGSKSLSFVAGTAGNTSHGSCWIDLQDQTGVTVSVLAGRGQTSTPTIFLAGADASTTSNTLTVRSGNVSVEPYNAPTGTTKYAAFASYSIGSPAGSATDPIVTIGANARFYLGNGGDLSSGKVISYATSKLAAETTTWDVFGGTLEMHANATAYGDFVVHDAGTLMMIGSTTPDSVKVYGGTVDCRQSSGSGQLTPKVYAGSSLYDPDGRYIITIDFVGCRASECTLDLPANRQFDLSAAATP